VDLINKAQQIIERAGRHGKAGRNICRFS